MLVVVVAVLSATAWHDLRLARADLQAARTTLDQLQADPQGLTTASGRAAGRSQLGDALVEVDRARHLLHDSPGLDLAALVPGLRRQRSGLLRLVDDSYAAVSTSSRLLAEMDDLSGQLQVQGGQLRLDALARFHDDVLGSSAQVSALVRSPAGLWGQLAGARRQFDDLASRVALRLGSGADDMTAARTFLGADGPRHYLLALENNSEMRDQGMVLDYATLTASDGRLTFGKTGRITDFTLNGPAGTPVPPDTQRFFGFTELTQLWQSVNATADFGLSGRAMVDMFAQATGGRIDGVIAVDVPGLASLLRVIGPVQITGVTEPITADNVGTVLLHDLYASDPSPSQDLRRGRIGDVAAQVIDRLTHQRLDAVSLGRDLAGAAAGGHIKVFSSAPAEEAIFEHTGLGGGPAAVSADRTFHVAVENRTSTKLDYYVHPSMAQRVRLTNLGTAIVHTTVTVDNRAPSGAMPSYQLGPDPTYPDYTPHAGDYLAWILCWGPQGSIQGGSAPEEGLRVSGSVVLVPAGRQIQAQFDTIIPNAVTDGRLALRYVPQPRLDPETLSVTLDAPGWTVAGSSTWQGPWDRTRTLSWAVHRR